LRNLPNIDFHGLAKFLSSTAFLAPPYFCFFPSFSSCSIKV